MRQWRGGIEIYVCEGLKNEIGWGYTATWSVAMAARMISPVSRSLCRQIKVVVDWEMEGVVRV
jgi:hypothetical protein